MAPVDFKRLPMTVALKPGLKLTGRVVNAATGRAIPNAEVQAVAPGGPWAPVTSRTDADGNYEFNTLGEATYQIYVSGANFIHHGNANFGMIKDTQYQEKEFRAGVRPICCCRSRRIRAANRGSNGERMNFEFCRKKKIQNPTSKPMTGSGQYLGFPEQGTCAGNRRFMPPCASKVGRSFPFKIPLNFN